MRSRVILETASDAVKVELRVLIEDVERDPNDWPDGYGICEAFDDLVDSDLSMTDRKLLNDVRKVQIALGDYKPMTESDIANTVVSSGKAWEFKMGGIPYQWAR